MKFADPKNDIAFKRIFGDENHTEVLISFLNSVLDFKGERKIKEVKTAFEKAKIYNWDKEELEVYDYVAIREGRRKSELETAKEDGIEIGENKAKIEIVKNALNNGIDIDIIILLTGLDKETIKNLSGQK